jgi:hypothetical protein
MFWNAVTSSLINLKAQIVRNFSDSLLYSGEKRLARALLSIANFYENAEPRASLKLSPAGVGQHDWCDPTTG